MSEFNIDGLGFNPTQNFPVPSNKAILNAGSIEIGNLLNGNNLSQTDQTPQINLRGQQPTQQQLEAREKFDKVRSSTGMSYAEAKAVIYEINKLYKDDKRYQSSFEAQQHSQLYTYNMPYNAFDPYKLPPKDKERYLNAIHAMLEIEQNNSALFAQTGLEKTIMPTTNYANRSFNF